MKPDHGQGCSCTSCVARSESERPSLRNIIADGSRIDKLYLGKYIPLREQKLLTKLIRTRAVYDDLRKELLSSSNVSVRGKADFRPRQRGSQHDDRDKSSTQAVLELVDLVDRGKASGSHKDLSECCSCCICQPNGPHAHDGKEHKRHGYGHHEGAHAHHKNERYSRKGTHSLHRQTHRGATHARHGSGHAISKISMGDRVKMSREARSKRQLRMKAKHVRSVPCTCTFDIKGTIQRKSKAMIKRMKMRPEKAVLGMEYVYGEQYEEKTFEKHGAYKAKALANKSLQKLKESETRIKRGLGAGAKTSLRKLKESKFMAEEHLQAGVTESIEKLKTGARKSIGKIRTGARKSAEKLKTTKNIMQEKIKVVRKSMQPKRLPKPIPKGKVIAKKLEEKSFLIKKDSIAKFREKLKLMEEMEAWACEHECFPEECDPEECLKILMRNRARKTRIRENEDKMSRKRERRIGNSLTSSSVNIQAQEMTTGAKVGTTIKEGIRKRKSTEQAKEMKTGARVVTGIKQSTQMKFNEQAKEKNTGATVGTGKQATQIKYTEQAKELKTSTRDGTGKKKGMQQIRPQFSINISTKKKKEGTKNVDTGTVKKEDILCLCKDYKKAQKSRSVKSMTDITQYGSKPSKTASMDDVNKKQMKLHKKQRKVYSTGVVQHSVEDTHTDRDGTFPTTVSNSSVNRQAVRISSSFSFNIEFYKDKPVKSSQTELEHKPDISNITQNHSGINVSKKHRGLDTRKPGQRHRTSEAILKKFKKDSQTGGHALKRCFCTLKLKSRRTKVKLTKSATKGTTAPKHLKDVTRHSTESVQTRKPHYLQKGLHLKPYECEPSVCIPGECDPNECYKLIKQRGVKKHHSARTSTAWQTKSATSLTKSISSSSSKIIQTYSPGNKNIIQRSPQIISERPLVRSYTPQKQAVRIGSTFSFNIEFYKDKPTNDAARVITSYSRDFLGEEKNLRIPKRKVDKGVDSKEPRHLKNRHSQGSASTLKSKYTATKHSLRRCFCTLKLKPGKGIVKTQSASKVSVTSRSVITQTRKLQEKRREVRNQRREHKNLLAHECEPGICTPGKCNPYECLKILNKRQGPRIRRHEKKSNTKNKSRSAASFTSRSLTPKAKRVQSSVVTYQTEVPARQYKENVIIKKMPREVKGSLSNPNRQAVRIGSTFSFDIEIFKDRTTNVAPKYVSTQRKPTTIVKKKNIRNTGSQGDTNRNQMSVSVQAEKQLHQNARIGSAMKRCFCTLKLYKDKKKKIDKKVKEMTTTGTATHILKEKKHQLMATKATKTKKTHIPYAHNLKPYECEPYVCTPGDCDPNVCLERIKRRGHSSEFGTSTDKTKMRSGSSFTQNTSISSATGTDRSRLRVQKTYTTPYRTRKTATPPTRVKKFADSVSMEHSRQAVKMGSNFSFNIEFYKDRRPLVERYVTLRTPKVKTKINDKTVRLKKDTGAEAREIFMSTHESQADGGKKKHKAASIKPALKRCFCTLKLHKKDKLPQNINNKTNLKPPKVYTISRMTIAETKMATHRQEYEYRFDPHRQEYIHRSKKIIELDTRNLPLGSRIEYTQIVPKYDRIIEYNSLLLTPFENSSSNNLQQSIRINSSFSISAKQIKDTNPNVFQSVSSTISRDDTKNKNNPPQSTKEFREQKQSNLDLNRCQVTGGSSFLSRCFCTMNISTDVTGHKLKPYECEPGICVPYECDPNECLKLITRRIRTGASKMSGTDATSRSTFTYSNLTPSQRAIKLQSNTVKHTAKSLQARNAFVKYKKDPNRPHKQMVRVGSTFSFDIQFSKDRPPVTRKYREGSRTKYHSDRTSIKTVNQRSKGTKGRHFNRHSRDSQSESKMINRGSNGTPMLKRCFCTLQLQQRHKQEKHIQQNASHTTSTMTSLNTKMEVLEAKTTKTSGQNTKPFKLRALDPNECEPNICIPGECNPHKCLEIIKSRHRKYKTKGFSTAPTESKSISSLTYSKKIRGQRVQSDSRGKRSRGNAAKFRDSDRRHTQSTKFLSPNKQVVRIGSNFSFNIEFYKNRMAQNHFQDTAKTITPRLKTHSKKRANRASRISTTTAARRHSQNTQAGIKTENQDVGLGPILKRCFCTLKLPNQSKPLQNEKVNMISEGTRTRAVKQTATMHTRSVMTKANKFKLKPYECEPNVCVPGECNPYECNKLIKNRLRKEFGTSTGPHGKRSVSSMSSPTSRAKTVQNAGMQYKQHDRQLQAKDVTAQRTAISDRPSRQSVRFGSRVSFDVEFFKDKTFNGSPTRSRLPEFKNESNYNGSFNKRPSIGTKNKRNITTKNIRNMESQAFAQKVLSTVTEMSPFLKRCFCTLRINKNSIKLAKPVDKRTISKTKIATTDNKIVKPAVTNAANSVDIKEVLVILPPKASTRSSKSIYRSTATMSKKRQPKRSQKRYPAIKLGPYECEPGVCVPGKCNPYMCAERIKRSGRGMQSRMSGTDGARGRAISSYTSPSARAKCTQAKCPGYKHRTTGNKERYVVEDRRFKSIENPFRQAVRISSSFSFNIEIYKDKMPVPAEMPYTSEGNLKNILNYEDTESKKVRNRSVHSQGTRVHNRGLQLKGTKTECRSTGVRPFLKRCLCTLKLQKMGDQPSPNIPDSKSVKTSTPRHYKPKEETMSIAVGTKKNKNNLKPFECEPNICVPGECDPYKCLELIKMRNRSTATLTSKHAKCQDTQCYKDPKSRCKNTQCYIKSQRTKYFSTKDLKHRTRYHPTSGNSNRQSVRIGSSFSFDCEFFKDHTPAFESKQKKVIGVNNRRNNTNKGSHCKSAYCHEKSQMAGVRTEHKSSGVGPFLKRCFCTSKLEKTLYAAHETKIVNFVSVKVKPQPAYLDSKAYGKKVGTEKKCTPRNPYDHQPQAIPGQYSYEPLFQMNLSAENATILNRDDIYENITKLKQPKKPKENKRPTQPRKVDNARQSLRYKRLSKIKATKKQEDKNMFQSRNTRQYPQQRAKSTSKAKQMSPMEGIEKKHTNKVSHDTNIFFYQKSQTSGAKTDSRGLKPLLKRCFCTLTLQKTPEENLKQNNQTKAANFVSFQVKPSAMPKVQTHNKNTTTKNKYAAQNVLSLSPYECEPLTCIPGQCDPYECLDRIKKRGLTVGSSTKICNVSSMATKCSTLSKCNKNVQCNFHDKRTAQTSYNPEPHVVKQPRYKNNLRSEVRYGSNISCSIEFFKEILTPLHLNLPIENHDRLDYNRPKAIKRVKQNKKIAYDACALKSCQSQSDIMNTQDKGVANTKRLQRCFCTLKHQNSPPTTKISPHPKEVTIRRVAVENDMMMSYLHRRNPQRTKQVLSRDRSCHDQKGYIALVNKNKHNMFASCGVCENNRIVFTKKQNRGINEIKTLFPYIPSKFNQNNSISALLSSMRACSIRKYRSRRNPSTNILRTHNMAPDRHDVTTKFFDEDVTNYDKQLSREPDTNISHSGYKFSFKNIVKRCTQLFNRFSNLGTDLNAHKDFTSEHVHYTARFNEVKKNNGRNPVKVQKTDALKATLSDRGPSHLKIVSIPKKSKSLKMTKAVESDRRHKNNIDDIKQERKKYSNFQCGDTGQTYKTPMKNYSKKGPPVAHRYSNQYICSHCQVIYDKDIKYLRNRVKPMFMNEKVVQFTLVSPDKEIQHKRKAKKLKNVCDDCGDNLCETDVNVFCPCTPGKKALKLQKKKLSMKQKVILPKEGILKNCQGDCKGSCESCADAENPKKHHKPKKNCQDDCQNNCEVHINNPQKLKKSKKVPKPEIPQNQEESCQTIKNSNTQKKKDLVTHKKGKEKHNCQVIDNNENQEKTQNVKRKKKSQKGKDDHFKCQKTAIKKEDKSKKGKERKAPQKPCLKANLSEKPDMPKKCEETKKLPKVQKMVCKTKNPCACCGLAQASKKTKSDITPPPHHLHWFSSNDKKCKGVCETQSEEEAMLKVMKIFEKCRSKMSVLFPPRKIDTCDYTPMFQMKMDAHNMAILNREEVIEKVTNLKKQQGGIDSITPEELRLLHGKSCRCCICQSVKHSQPSQVVGLSLSLAQKASKFGRMFGIGKEPCICGSAPCASELRKMERKSKQQKKLEERRKHPCVCGTKVCALESLKMELRTHAISKKGAKKLKKDLKKKAKSKQILAEQNRKKAKALKEYLERQKRYKKEDNIRRKRRRKEEKLMDAQVKKYRNTSAWLLAAESMVDIGQLAGKTATGLVRTLGRLIMDPKRTIRQMRDAKQDPGRILTNLKMAWSDSGIGSTAKRVKRRVGAMTCFERFKACMESHAMTNYFYHMCDKNPKARLTAKKRLVRKRVPMDFECSLYMASLRKKPWLKMYYKFQWFYPHCISLLHLLRSVGDVMLFLLAVIVWSPCLLAMECCRTLMCCTLCTG